MGNQYDLPHLPGEMGVFLRPGKIGLTNTYRNLFKYADISNFIVRFTSQLVQRY